MPVSEGKPIEMLSLPDAEFVEIEVPRPPLDPVVLVLVLVWGKRFISRSVFTCYTLAMSTAETRAVVANTMKKLFIFVD